MPRRIQSSIYAGFECSCESCNVNLVLTQAQVLRQRKIKVILCDDCYKQKRTNDCKRIKSSDKCKFTQLIGKAGVRGIGVGITFDYYTANLSNKPCHYCGDVVVHSGGGVDRIDSSVGYVEGNVVPCCPTCNVMKNEHTQEDMLNHMIKMLTHAGFNISKKEV